MTDPQTLQALLSIPAVREAALKVTDSELEQIARLLADAKAAADELAAWRAGPERKRRDALREKVEQARKALEAAEAECDQASWEYTSREDRLLDVSRAARQAAAAFEPSVFVMIRGALRERMNRANTFNDKDEHSRLAALWERLNRALAGPTSNLRREAAELARLAGVAP